MQTLQSMKIVSAASDHIVKEFIKFLCIWAGNWGNLWSYFILGLRSSHTHTQDIFIFMSLNIFHVNKQARSDMFKYRGAKVYYFSLNKLPLFLYLWINLSLIQFEKFRSSANILIAYLFYWRFLCSCISESTHVRQTWILDIMFLLIRKWCYKRYIQWPMHLTSSQDLYHSSMIRLNWRKILKIIIKLAKN